ncbi:MAG: hypothetical protein GQ574_06640 [Crocinitomix sp.]|nr:hypothetical protein [Crocinitomix sp.]
MSWFKNNKFDLIGIGIILFLFLISIQVREENLKAPLGRHHEWITAHSLITAEIWDENGGPSNYGFSPVYSYQDIGSTNRRILGGVSANNGDVYYTSYPPFAFIYLYYSSQFTGGPTVFSARFASLSIHLVSAILLYFLIAVARPKPENKALNFAGIIGAGLYLFAQGHLWFHGNLYFSDMVVQPFFIGGLFLSVRYLRNLYKSEKLILILLFITFFLGAYTEWISLFSAFYTGLFFLGAAIVKKQKKYLRPFFAIAMGSAMAIGLTVYQYASINGWESLKATAEKKYDERSGHSVADTVDPNFSIHNSDSFTLLKSTFNSYYKSTENYIALAFIILVLLLILRRIKRFSHTNIPLNFKWSALIIVLLLIPIVTHYYLFYDFNTKHYFSGLKTGTLLICLAALIVQAAHAYSVQLHTYIGWVAIAAFSALFIHKANQATTRYLHDHTIEMLDVDRVNSAQEIAKHRIPEAAIFTNVRVSPEQIFYAKHCVSPIKDSDTSAIAHIMDLYKNTKGQYYHHEGSKLKAMVTIELHDDNLVFLDTITFK